MKANEIATAANIRTGRLRDDITNKILNRSYYDFKYLPLAGALSGEYFEQQTEDAINDIGNVAYATEEVTNNALQIAQQAYNAAQAAIETADNAIALANAAQQTANTALTAANNAQTSADAAQASANNALNVAQQATQAAAAAQTTANNAQNSANQAVETANNALDAATTAQGDASSAISRLDIIEPIVDELRYYDNITANVDFNTKTEFAREYLQGTANTNGPVSGPGWLDVDDDFDDTFVRQKFVADTDDATYIRIGTVVPDSDPIEVSTWSAWVKYALDSDLTAAVSDVTTQLTTAINAVDTKLIAHEADFSNPHQVTAAQLGLSNAYKYKGSVTTYADLPTTGNENGDVWNVETADPDHGIKAGDNVAWDGTAWDNLGGNHDFSELIAEINARLPLAGGTMNGTIRFEDSTQVKGILDKDGNGIVMTGTPPNVPFIIDASKKPGQTVYIALQSPDGGSFSTVRFSLNNDSFATITGVGTPTNPNDVANKNYVDSAIASAVLANIGGTAEKATIDLLGQKTLSVGMGNFVTLGNETPQLSISAEETNILGNLTVGTNTSGISPNNGVIRGGNAENCLYFTGTAENTFYSVPINLAQIAYQPSCNRYMINCGTNNPANLTVNLSTMNFKAFVGSIPMMQKTFTFTFGTGSVVPAVAWTMPAGARVMYPSGAAPVLTATATNIINVIAWVDDTDSFTIQVCDTLSIPLSA